MNDETTGLTKRAQMLAEACSVILAGEEPRAVGAALGDLVAMWLAGHSIRHQSDDTTAEPATDEFRVQLLARHCDLVRMLLPVNVAILEEREKEEEKPQ